ncbi:MAG: efflux RND transporter periplasmic adaptor subunit [Pyrinomonadaceae bacterium]|nr:efflux RND transporter periplasmic adaptor subunit [Pyrinomonadaceae bacterium]
MSKQTNSKSAVFGVLLSVVVLFAASCSGSKAKSNDNANANNAPTIVAVQTAQAIVQNMPTYFEATGNLASDAQTDVAPTVPGKIVEVNFDIGSYVNKGDVLVRLDSRDAQIRLEQAQANVEQQRKSILQAQANVEQTIASLRQTQARLNVKDGEIFNIETFSQVRSINAQLELAEKELGRATRLLESGDVSRSIYDQRKSQRDALLGQLAEARSNAAVAVKAIDTARAQVATVRTAVGNANAAVATAQTQVDAARKAVGDAVIYAPISGFVAERNADLGEFAATSNKVATIVRTSVLRVRIDVPEQAIAQIKTGQEISLQTSAFPDRNFAGTVVRIAPNLNATSRVLVVEAEVENSQGLLKPGQFATVRIAQSAAKPTIMIPASAVKTEGDNNKIFVVKDGRAEERTVILGVLENDKIEVKQGVQENEADVISNLNQVYDGVNVRQ